MTVSMSHHKVIKRRIGDQRAHCKNTKLQPKVKKQQSSRLSAVRIVESGWPSGDEGMEKLAILRSYMGEGRKVVVVTGAGISTKTGST